MAEDRIPRDTGTFLLPFRRERLLHFLPRRARVAEIGVAQGHFAREIFFRTWPKKLALIDCWDMIDRSDREDDADLPQSLQDRRYRGVKRFFAPLRLVSDIDIVKAWSADAARDMPDGAFDWVFVDGDHAEDAVLADLEAWAPKVAEDGFILGHDFAPFSEKHHGVVRAVRRFIEAHPEMRLLAVTGEQYATYLIAKAPDAPRTKAFVDRIVNRVPFKIVLDHETVFSLRQERVRSKRLTRSAMFYVGRDNPPI